MKIPAAGHTPMKSVVLVYPKTGFDRIRRVVDLPLSLLTVASTVRDDYEVTIIDQRVLGRWEDALMTALAKAPLCVGISAMTGSQIGFGLDAARVVKHFTAQRGTGTKVVWGGIHGTLLPEQTLQHDLIDILVPGEGELTFRDLVRALEGGRPLSCVQGILYKEEGEIIRTGDREKASLEDLPELPYELVDIENYVHSKSMITEKVNRVLPFISSRGCPYSCTYCCNPWLSGKRWRAMSAEKTYERVKKLIDRYRLDGIVFHDENFLSNPARAMRIAELINDQFAWSIQGRMDSILEIDIEKMARLGLKMVQPGIESGSDVILEMIQKGEDRKTMEEANRKLARTEIIPVYNFMIGLPRETFAQTMETVDFALELLRDNRKVEISGFYILVPYPGTEIFQAAVEQGFNAPSTLEGWALFDRQHNETPWVREQRKLLNSIMMSSKFIDGKRMIKLLGNPLFWIPVKLLSLYYKAMWKRHSFSSPLTDFLVARFRAETRLPKGGAFSNPGMAGKT